MLFAQLIGDLTSGCFVMQADAAQSGVSQHVQLRGQVIGIGEGGHGTDTAAGDKVAHDARGRGVHAKVISGNDNATLGTHASSASGRRMKREISVPISMNTSG